MSRLPYERAVIMLIISAFVGLAVGFSLGPIFEGPDEIEHYRFVRYVQRQQALPDPAGQPNGQFHQAPLYYVLLAPIAALLPDDDFSQIDGRINPYHGYQFEQPGNDNKNLYLHTRAEAFPYTSPTARAVHLLRLASIAIAAVTVYLVYRIMCLLWPDAPYRRLLALLTVAFWPQFMYLSSVINNDNLAILLATLACYLVLRQQKDGYTWRRSTALGVTLGAALLTKSSLTLLAVPVGLAVLSERRSWRYATLTLALTLLLAGWWYLRNLALTGDPTGIQAMFITWPDQTLRQGEMALDIGLQRAPYAYQTLWARFGAGSVAVAEWIYRLFDALVLAGSLGLVVQIARKLRSQSQPMNALIWRQSLTITAFALVWIISLVMSASVASAGNQGRYLFPGIAAWSILLAFGLDAWLMRLPRKLTTPVYGITLGSVVLVCLFGYFYPAYRALPEPATIAKPLHYQYGNQARLLGMAPKNPTVAPGETATIELYWEALQPGDPGLQVYLHTAFAESLLWRDSIPGNGHRPADDWQPGERWTERYIFTAPPTLVPGQSYLLTAGLYQPQTGESIAATAPDGTSPGDAPVIATLEIVAPGQ